MIFRLKIQIDPVQDRGLDRKPRIQGHTTPNGPGQGGSKETTDQDGWNNGGWGCIRFMQIEFDADVGFCVFVGLFPVVNVNW